MPAGVRGQAGTRLATLLSARPTTAASAGGRRSPEKQLAVLKVLAAAKEPLAPQELARAARCTPAPITALRRKGLIRARTGRIACRSEAGRAAGDGEQQSGAQSRSSSRPCERSSTRLRAGSTQDDPASTA